MKSGIAIKRNTGYRSQIEQFPSGLEGATNLDLILAWACLAASHVRRSIAGIEKNREILKRRGETERRLEEFNYWRRSTAFTEREKAALSLGESLALKQAGEISKSVFKEAKSYFNREEMIGLTLGIHAANDWIDHHSNPSVRILVVEDDLLDQDLLRRQLQKAGMENNVAFVSNSIQALDLLECSQREPFEYKWIAVFLDIHLPGMNGIELLQRIRAMPNGEGLPVIMMTSSIDPRDVEECKKLKVVSYVEKPVTYSAFSKAVANIFHQTKVPRQPQAMVG